MTKRERISAHLEGFWDRQQARVREREYYRRLYAEAFPINAPCRRDAEAIPEYPRTHHQRMDLREAK